MNVESRQQNGVCPAAWLGAGGENPRVEMIDGQSRQNLRLLDLSAGHSVYTLAMTDNLSRLAIGTRGGEIQVTRAVRSKVESGDRVERVFNQQAPVLSLCFTDDDGLIASDTTGHCLHWRLDADPVTPQSLPVQSGTILALMSLANGEAAGLSVEGELLFWSTDDQTIVRAFEGPAPAASALVTLNYWPAEHAIVYPARNGELVLYQVGHKEIITRPAHEGEFCVVLASASSLLTAGRRDRTLKEWRPGEMNPAWQASAPCGLISGCVLDEARRRFVLVGDNGDAGIFTILDRTLECERRLPGRDYRLAVAPTPDRVAAYHQRYRRDEARQIALQVRQQLAQGESDGLDQLHTRLRHLGYEHLSLALHAEQAAQAKDLLGELRARSTLIRLLPQGDPAICSSLDLYASLLDRLWQFEEAEDVRARIRVLERSQSQQQDRTPVDDFVRDEHGILEPDLPLPVMVEAASILNRGFTGRCQLADLGAIPCRGITLQHANIVSKYNQVRGERPDEVLPEATLEEVIWRSRRETRSTPTLLLFDAEHEDIRGLGCAYQVRHDGLQTVIVPAIVFDADMARPADEPQEHNRQVLAALDRIRNGTLSNSWVDKVHSVMTVVLRRLITENLSR